MSIVKRALYMSSFSTILLILACSPRAFDLDSLERMVSSKDFLETKKTVVGLPYKIQTKDSFKNFQAKLLQDENGNYPYALHNFFHKGYFFAFLLKRQPSGEKTILDMVREYRPEGSTIWSGPILVDDKDSLWDEIVFLKKYHTDLPTQEDVIAIYHVNLERGVFEKPNYEKVELFSEE